MCVHPSVDIWTSCQPTSPTPSGRWLSSPACMVGSGTVKASPSMRPTRSCRTMILVLHATCRRQSICVWVPSLDVGVRSPCVTHASSMCVRLPTTGAVGPRRPEGEQGQQGPWTKPECRLVQSLCPDRQIGPRDQVQWILRRTAMHHASHRLLLVA